MAKEPKEEEGLITIEGIEEIATESKTSLADIDTIQELQDTIAFLESTIDDQDKQIERLMTDLETVDSDTAASSETIDTQNLEDTIASLNAELESRSSALGEAENQIAVQEEQINTLKYELDTLLSDVYEKLN